MVMIALRLWKRGEVGVGVEEERERICSQIFDEGWRAENVLAGKKVILEKRRKRSLGEESDW
jgi:hypothetical protein